MPVYNLHWHSLALIVNFWQFLYTWRAREMVTNILTLGGQNLTNML